MLRGLPDEPKIRGGTGPAQSATLLSVSGGIMDEFFLFYSYYLKMMGI